MTKNAPLDGSDEDEFSEVERERQRELRSNYVKSGIHMSRNHKQWVKGRRAAEAAGASQTTEMSAAQQVSNPDLAPKLGGDSLQACNALYFNNNNANLNYRRLLRVRVRTRRLRPKEQSKCIQNTEENGARLRQLSILEHQKTGYHKIPLHN